jgi:serine/threonine protein kinase
MTLLLVIFCGSYSRAGEETLTARRQAVNIHVYGRGSVFGSAMEDPSAPSGESLAIDDLFDGQLQGRGDIGRTVRFWFNRTNMEDHVRHGWRHIYVQESQLLKLSRNIARLLGNHDHILKGYGTFRVGSKACVVMEDLSGWSESFDFVNGDGPLLEANLRSFMKQLVSAVSYMHRIDMSHNDIKPNSSANL